MNEELNKEELKEEVTEEVTEEETKEETKEEASEETVEKSEVEILNEKIEELNKQLSTAKNDYFKAYADAENRKKRLQQDYETNMKYRIQSFVLDILPALDNFERAINVKVEDEAVANYISGFKMIYDQLMNALSKEGVEVIEAKDKPFDANLHHAIMTEHVDGVEKDMVLEELQKGYKLKDRVIRATLVKVSE